MVLTIPRSQRVSTENGWRSLLLGNLICFSLNGLQLKSLIPIEHDLNVQQVKQNNSLFPQMIVLWSVGAKLHFSSVLIKGEAGHRQRI